MKALHRTLDPRRHAGRVPSGRGVCKEYLPGVLATNTVWGVRKDHLPGVRKEYLLVVRKELHQSKTDAELIYRCYEYINN